jgi:hypothetical protein
MSPTERLLAAADKSSNTGIENKELVVNITLYVGIEIF